MIIIGIDPGKETGLAVYDTKTRKIREVFMTDFWGAYEYVNDIIRGMILEKVIIEVPRTKTNWHKKGCDITSANVGGIYREAHLLADGIEKLGVKVVRSHPAGKECAAYIKRLTGYTGRTNEHTRDAIMLCWGY